MEKTKIPRKKLQVEEIQNHITTQNGLDGWLIYDFRGNNALGLDLLGIDEHQLLSRRFFYWIPKKGQPVKIVHNIETHPLKHLPGIEIAYDSWQSLDTALATTLKGKKRIAMEHFPKGAIPVLSTLDSGLYEWLSDKKIEVTNSWNIAKNFICRWSPAQLKSHREATSFLMECFESSFERVRESLSAKKKITEYMLQQEIVSAFQNHHFVTEHDPIVASGKNSALPHYCPGQGQDSQITKESLLLIDIWCKKATPSATFSDLTQVAYFGKKPPQEMLNVYKVVKEAQNAGISYVKKQLKKGMEVLGCDVDDACRKVIEKAGFGKYFVHRTGHNIHTMMHGLGPNLDNYETHDTRPLMPRTCYSIEPGIYIPKGFGIRLECNIFIHDDLTVEVSGESPDDLPIF